MAKICRKTLMLATMMVAAPPVGAGDTGGGPKAARNISIVTDVDPSQEWTARDRELRRRHHTMGTWLEVSIRASSRQIALVASEAAFQAVDDAERRLSTWRNDSELAAVNDNAARSWVELSPLLARDLSAALLWQARTDVAFHPGVGALLAAWDLRGQGRVPSDDELTAALAASSAGAIQLDGSRVRLSRDGVRIEEGGFGKGAALTDAITAALGSGARCVILDFGGQVAVGGACGAVAVGVADPRDRHAEVVIVELAAGSAATAGGSERGVVVDGVRLGHILDPRSGRPAEDWGTITAIAADPLTADCVATAVFVMGPRAGAEWVAGRPDIEAVFAETAGGDVRLAATTGLRGRLHAPQGRVIDWIPNVVPREHGPPP